MLWRRRDILWTEGTSPLYNKTKTKIEEENVKNIHQRVSNFNNTFNCVV